MPALHSQRSAGGPALLCVPRRSNTGRGWEGPACRRQTLAGEAAEHGGGGSEASRTTVGARPTCTTPAPSQAAHPAAPFRWPPHLQPHAPPSLGQA